MPTARSSVNEPLHRALGLTDDEAVNIDEILDRPANPLELAMYSVMWSEHCSYKSSRIHLKRLPTEAPWVLVGPGENAGVVDVGDGIAAAIRIESHNHPSAIEPYQGAATGAGGILRDIFTMGARPIALMDPLRFGPLDDPRSRWIAEGVVAGISGYGNAVGVPTVGGETVFDATYKGNPLVNVLCLGLLPTDRLVLGQASGVGNLAVLLGNATGRDGIGGVSVLASAGFSEEDDGDKRPSVQVGDPYEEKRLIEACLALLDEKLVVGIQDLGGAGLACATSETASRGGVGMDVDVTAIPRREPGMEPHEVMTSESQERMLAIVEPEVLARVLEICARWEVQATVIGRVTDGGALRILEGFEGPVLADIPASSLHDLAPLYERPLKAPEEPLGPSADQLAAPVDPGAELMDLLQDLSWVYSQYDHQLFLNTVVGPGDDATVLRLKHPTTGEDTGRGLALTTDGNHRWCAVDPRAGTALVVAESVLNLACVGGRPLAVVNCLNFGNPEHPEVMWQLSEAIDGMSEACLAFDVPVVGGNVSLYNESAGNDIAPTPVIGLLGLVDELSHRPPGAVLKEGHRLVLLGPEAEGLGGSLWGATHDAPGGDLPALDYEMHRRVAALVRQLVADQMLGGVHDLSSGGLGVALAEMAARSGVGVSLARTPDHRALFNEGPSRVVLVVDPERLTEVLAACDEAEVPTARIGLATGQRFVVKDLLDLSLEELTAAFKSPLPEALGAGTTNR
ncbi:MAG: phosphoribosylformylglycinamidine synthase subunit PurL [Actinobacteria bacterium]|nr:phosphoribosylformylglycinamidine synthase subunit PurL [Actinomycetota bacterium]MBT7133221.1 phosphoribosylformylglycinamidine synthase subunit PurL [Actinomycetota bacterium]MBT7470944.1 phosphoribosylformylglycinamidine synthase subunit PurL [Actinomycetota bacterium]MBT7868664.1 phosphoribosylformylglycinamidine synthase subunit PurL [Actinomycetota bacterium]